MNYRPYIFSKILIIDIFSVSFMLYNLNMLFTSNPMFLSPMYLLVVPQSNMGCFNVGLPSVDSLLTGLLLTPWLLSLMAAAMACTAASWPLLLAS